MQFKFCFKNKARFLSAFEMTDMDKIALCFDPVGLKNLLDLNVLKRYLLQIGFKNTALKEKN